MISAFAAAAATASTSFASSTALAKSTFAVPSSCKSDASGATATAADFLFIHQGKERDDKDEDE